MKLPVWEICMREHILFFSVIFFIWIVSNIVRGTVSLYLYLHNNILIFFMNVIQSTIRWFYVSFDTYFNEIKDSKSVVFFYWPLLRRDLLSSIIDLNEYKSIRWSSILSISNKYICQFSYKFKHCYNLER